MNGPSVAGEIEKRMMMEKNIAEQLMWRDRAQVFAFIGNSLLSPMSQTETAGLSRSLWRDFPDFTCPEIAGAIAELDAFTECVEKHPGIDWVQSVSVEFTELFVGPPCPLAPPWESSYLADGNGAGFGKATFEMQQILREAGLGIDNRNNQYADHIGIELLYLSDRCSKIADSGKGVGAAMAFALAHPVSWIGRLQDKVHAAAPCGYYDSLIRLARENLRYLIDGTTGGSCTFDNAGES